jgi:large subunit ribosomal protein L1
MKHHGKRYHASRQKIDRSRKYPLPEAVKLVKETATAKFSETVLLSVKLGVDPKQSDQNIRGSISLPKGIGKEKKVIAFCDGADIKACQDAGAVKAGGQELVQEIEGGWMDFDVALATPPMMRFVGKLGRVLGPQGKMPTPKAGTVTEDIATAVSEFRAGRVEYRNDTTGNLHVIVGKASFDEADLVANVSTFLEHLSGLRPSALKGQFVEKVFLSSTMGPSVPVAV